MLPSAWLKLTVILPPSVLESARPTGFAGILDAEGSSGHQVQGEAGVAAHVAEDAGIDAEDGVTDQHRPDEAGEVQAVAQLAAHAHRCREEGESQHDDEHRKEAFSGGIRDRLQREIAVVHVACVFGEELFEFFHTNFPLKDSKKEHQGFFFKPGARMIDLRLFGTALLSCTSHIIFGNRLSVNNSEDGIFNKIC